MFFTKGSQCPGGNPPWPGANPIWGRFETPPGILFDLICGANPIWGHFETPPAMIFDLFAVLALFRGVY